MTKEQIDALQAIVDAERDKLSLQEAIDSNRVPEVESTKSELDLLKEKFATGEYVCYCSVAKSNTWFLTLEPMWSNAYEYKLIHVKDAEIAEAVAKDSSVKYIKGSEKWEMQGMFFEQYDEDCEYQLKPTKPKGRYIPEDFKKYFNVRDTGEVIQLRNDSDYDDECISFGNCFRTKEHAEQARDYLAKVLPIIGFVLEHQGDFEGEYYLFNGYYGGWTTGKHTKGNKYPDMITMQKETAEALLADEDMMKILNGCE